MISIHISDNTASTLFQFIHNFKRITGEDLTMEQAVNASATMANVEVMRSQAAKNARLGKHSKVIQIGSKEG